MDAVFQVTKNDPEMKAAIKKARTTLSEFLTEADADLQRAIPALDDVLLKVYIASSDNPNDGEHLWIRYIGRDPEHEDRYRGIMLRKPKKVNQIVSEGDTVNLSIKSLSDWLYVEDGKAHGAFTVRVLRSRMSPTELNEHDKLYPFSFD
jgi:uncharacterized protein YegJ (DUF2314 family)